MVRYIKMRNFLVIFISLNSCLGATLITLEQRVENLEKNDKTAKAKVVALEKIVKSLETEVQKLKETNVAMKMEGDTKIQNLEANVTRLEKKVQQQELQLFVLVDRERHKHKTLSTSVDLNKQNSAPRNVYHRTCHEARAANASLVSGMHWIDPDGQGVGDDPIYVHCNFTTGTTSILHDSESTMDVGHCANHGCYSRKILYYASNKQIDALVELSTECHQSFRYDCIGAPFHFNGAAFSWWNDKNGSPRYFWSGSNASYHTCQCGIDGNCAEAFMKCNCDSALNTNSSDSGIITAKNLLPVTKLNFGRTQLASSSGFHALGRFECSGQETVSGMPKSCADLWRIGHNLSGFYSVLGAKQIETVYCDFTKLPNVPGIQTWIGYVDVKSSPVYFYVQKTHAYSALNVPIPFEIERLNIGGAMHLASGTFTAPKTGRYFFSLSGIGEFPSGNGHLDIGLYLNGNRIGRAQCDAYSNSKSEWGTYSLESTLQMKAGDKVNLKIPTLYGSILQDQNWGPFTHFTGWLLEEDVALSVGK